MCSLVSDRCGVNMLHFARDQSSRVLSCCVFLCSQFSVYSLPSHLPHVSPALFSQFLSWSCVLWLIHPCTSLRTQEGSFQLWRCVNTDSVCCPLPSLTLRRLWRLDCGRWSPNATLSASWSDWGLDWTDPLFLFFALNYGLRPSLPAEFCVPRL